MSHYCLNLKPLTGLHIGTGIELSPLEYSLMTMKQGTRVVQFNSELFVRTLNAEQKKDFFSITKSDNIVALRKFFYNNLPKAIATNSDVFLNSCEPTEEFFRLFQSSLENSNNALIYQPTYAAPGSRYPTIPGSSIKGAIRTALFDSILDHDNPCQLDSRRGARPEQNILGYKDIKFDPYRCLRISDTEINEKNVKLAGCMHLYKTKDESLAGIKIQVEIIRGVLMSGEDKTYRVNIEIDEALQREMVQNEKSSRYKITPEKIVKSCKDFYDKGFNVEYDLFYRKASDSMHQNIQGLLEAVDTLKENEFLLRLGRWSQIEFVTLNTPYRKPWNPTWHNKSMSRTLFNYNNQYLPLGWCLCSLEPRKNA